MSLRAVAVALVAAATLAFEILLVRVFAIEHFHHIAYMAIGVAMLGIGASGSFVAVLGGISSDAAERWFPTATVVTALTLIVTPAVLDRIPLDLTRLAWSAEQWVRLGVVYLLLAVPFASSAVAILVGITLERSRPGWIYGASFLGSGVGALLAVAVLWIAHPSRALAMPALLASFGAAVGAWSGTRRRREVVTGAVTVAAASLVAFHPLWKMTVSPYKALPQVEAYPDARRVAERTSPLGWAVAVHAPAFRHAPGLSLAYVGEFPAQTALFVDGEIATAVTRWGASGTDRSAMEILGWLPTALPYALGERNSVLVLAAGGGMDVWSAVAHGARRVLAVELNADLITLSSDLAPLPTKATTGVTKEMPGVKIDWVVGDARAVVARTREQFDLITLAPGGGLSGAAGGVHALNEDFLHTTDAYAQFLRRLAPHGVLAVTRWITVPPRASVRALLTAADALRRVAPSAAHNGIVLARSWGTTTMLVKPSGFSSTDVERLGAWAASRQLDLDWYPGAVNPVAQYHMSDDQTFVHAARAVAHPDSARRFADAYVFAVSPATDARPYPHRFLRAGSVRSLLRSGSTTWLPFAEWGYIALLATLAQSVLLATLLILLPALLRPRRPRGRADSLLPLVAYFSAIGLGYMAAEIALIQQLTLLLGHPVYAVATVLAGILIFSGVGSAWSDRLAPSRAPILAALLGAALALCAALLLDGVHLLQPASILTRGAAASVMLAPVAIGMGTLFPLGLRGLAGDDSGRIAWGWAANGFASVVGVPLAALIAVEAGSRMLLLVAATAYLFAPLVARRGWASRA
jgi:spermidine synthase